MNLKGVVFRAFIAAVAVAMIVAVYGSLAKNMAIILTGVVFGLMATVVGWLGFIKDLKNEAQAQTAESSKT